MKYNFAIVFIIFFGMSAFSQMSRLEYIQKYQLLAIKEMNRSGIPASITMAQACLESADGNSELAKKSNNHFGIKCKSGWKGKKVFYDDDARNECFRKYNTVEESFDDHTNFLSNNPRYSFLFEFEPTDYRAWAVGLKKAGYATARHYDNSLIKIIEDFQLHRLDNKLTLDEMTVFEQKKIRNEGISNTLTINPYRTHELSTINGLKSVAAKKGDSFEAIAQEFGLEPWELYKFNDLPKGHVPQANEVIYLKLKKRRGPRNNPTHTVEPGETMHYISQLYGIRLKPLYSRNRMKYGEQPDVGEVIYLRKRKKNG